MRHGCKSNILLKANITELHLFGFWKPSNAIIKVGSYTSFMSFHNIQLFGRCFKPLVGLVFRIDQLKGI